MKIKFKDGHEIEFKKFGNIWLAESVIMEGVGVCASHDDLRILKAHVAQWFKKNAPKEIREKYKASLPLSDEIDHLPLKDQLAYREGKTDEITDYFLGDETVPFPVRCRMRYGNDDKSDYFYCLTGYSWADPSAVRLCLEEIV